MKSKSTGHPDDFQGKDGEHIYWENLNPWDTAAVIRKIMTTVTMTHVNIEVKKKHSCPIQAQAKHGHSNLKGEGKSAEPSRRRSRPSTLPARKWPRYEDNAYPKPAESRQLGNTIALPGQSCSCDGNHRCTGQKLVPCDHRDPIHLFL